MQPEACRKISFSEYVNPSSSQTLIQLHVDCYLPLVCCLCFPPFFMNCIFDGLTNKFYAYLRVILSLSKIFLKRIKRPKKK